MAENTSSAASASSAGAGDSAAANEPLRADDGLDMHERQLETGLWGLLYTVSKEKGVIPLWFVIFRLFMDFWQLALLTVNPLYGFDINPDATWWRVVSFIQLNAFMSGRGYTFFLALLYIMVVGLVLAVGLSIWVMYSFQQNRFSVVWPIEVLRAFGTIFFQVLDVASMTFFLMAVDCQYFDIHPVENRYHNAEFPTVECWKLPHLAHAVVAIVSLVVFVIMAALFQMGDMELDLTTRNPLAMAHSELEVVGFFVKVVMTCASVLINNNKWLAVIQLVCATILFVMYARWVPHYYNFTNHIRLATYGAVLWSAIMFAVVSFHFTVDWKDLDKRETFQHNVTIILWVGFAPCAMLGALVSWLRLRYYQVTVLNRFRNATPETKPKDLCVFKDARQVEIVARCCRVFIDVYDTIDPGAIKLAEQVINCGLAQLPKDPFMSIFYSSFLIDVRKLYRSGYTQLQAAKKMDPSFLERFAIFTREQQHTQKSSTGHTGSMDLVAYVEFQRNYSLVLKVHREALLAMRFFWVQLQNHRIPFESLSRAVESMDRAVRAAEQAYRTVLQRHSTNVKMLRLYAKFLLHVKHDPWSAAKWFAEADKAEVKEEEAKEDDMLQSLNLEPELRDAFLTTRGIGGSATANKASGSGGLGVVLINAFGVVQMTNDGLDSLLGYSSKELHGKSVNLIIPPPFSHRHDGYLRTYTATGRAVIQGMVNQMLALHKEGRFIPVSLKVAKVFGNAEDAMFLGMMEESPSPPDTATLWVLPNGSVMSADAVYTDMCGFKATAVAGLPISSLVRDAPEVLGVLKASREAALRGVGIGEDDNWAKDGTTNNSTSGFGNDEESLLDRKITGKGPLSPTSIMGEKTLSGVSDTSRKSLAQQSSRFDNLTAITTKDAAGNVVSWIIPNVRIHHKYSPDPVYVTMSVTNGGIGTHMFHVINMVRVMPPAAVPVRANGAASGAGALTVASPLPRKVANANTSSPPPPNLQLVVDTKGCVAHVTFALAARLGSTPEHIKANGAANAFQALLMEPLAQLHKQHLSAALPNAPPPFGCRAGLSVVLARRRGPGEDLELGGTDAYTPFHMTLAQKVTDDMLHHVANFKEVAPTQALSERRLLLRIDQHGNIHRVSRHTPTSLFGIKPSKLVGQNIMALLDVLKPGGPDDPSPMAALAEMALRTMDTPGLSWRVGVQAFDEGNTRPTNNNLLSGRMKPRAARPSVMRMFLRDQSDDYEDATQMQRYARMPRHFGFEAEDEESLIELEDLEEPDLDLEAGGEDQPQAGHSPAQLNGMQIDTSAVPAAATRREVGSTEVHDGGLFASGGAAGNTPTLRESMPDNDGGESEESGMLIDVELWRADMLMGFVQVDAHGTVTSGSTTWDHMLYDAGLVTGADPASLEGMHIAELLPVMEGKPISELFNTQLSQPKGAVNNRGGALKVSKPGASRVGVAHILASRHFGDEAPSKLVVQAIHRANGCWVVLRPHQPTCGRPDFKTFIAGADQVLAAMESQAGMLASQVPAIPIGSKTIADHVQASKQNPQGRARRRSSLLMTSRMQSPPTGLFTDDNINAAMAEGDAHLSAIGGIHYADSPRGTAALAGGAHTAFDHLGDQTTSLPGAVDAKHESIKTWLESEGRVYPYTEGQQEGGPNNRKQATVASNNNVASPVSVANENRSSDGSDRPDVFMSKRNGGSSGSDSDADHYGVHKLHGSSVGGASELDDAENADNMVDDQAYKRGRRYKKLVRLLTSPMVQEVPIIFLKHTMSLVTILLSLHLFQYILMFTLLKNQDKNVHLLNLIGRAAAEAATMASVVRILQALMLGLTLPQGLSGTPAIQVMAGVMKNSTNNFMELHTGAFLGYNGSRFRMPTREGLRELWEGESMKALIQYRMYADETRGNNTVLSLVSKNVTTSLFRIGCQYFANGLDILQNIAEVRAAGTAVAWPEARFITLNYDTAISPGYNQTMDAMVSYVVDKTKQVNIIHVYFLIGEGVVVCGLAMAYMFFVGSKLAKHRYSLYSVFMVVPASVVRHLATRRMGLTEDEETTGDPSDPANIAASNALKISGMAVAAERGTSEGGVGAGTMKVSASTGHGFAVRADRAWSYVLACFRWRSTAVVPLDKDKEKRTLVPSYKRTLQMLVLYAIGGSLSIIFNAACFISLKNIQQPIATFNIVNTVDVLFTRFFFSVIALTISNAKPTPASRGDVMDKLNELKLQYMAMVYGNEAVPPALRTSPHYMYVKEGVAHTIQKGADILFNVKDYCMLVDQTACPTRTNPNYQLLTSGLNNLFLRFFDVEGGIGTLQGADPVLTGPEVTYLFLTYNHLKGGLSQVNQIYEDYVNSVYAKVRLLHTVLLILVLSTGTTFLITVLKPVMQQSINEPRRIAELLGHLPPDLDVESVVVRKLREAGATRAPPPLESSSQKT